MLKRISRALDLVFVFSERARLAQMASMVNGMPMELMYDGGLEVKACDLQDSFHTGKPSFDRATKCVLAQLQDDDGLILRNVLYLPEVDGWQEERQRPGFDVKPRLETDLYLPADAYYDAFVAACHRANIRNQHSQGN